MRHKVETSKNRAARSIMMAQNMVKLANATGNPADPEVAQVAKRRRFTNQYKLKITTEADKCTQRGDIGMLLRREGLYSWHLKYFREWRDNMSSEKKPSPKSSTIVQLRNELARTTRENNRLKLKLKRANSMLDLQKKMAEIYQNEIAENCESEA
jgi:transposase